LNRIHDPKLSSNARTLRKNMTKEERHLWYDFLKDLPIMVHRQRVIGSYIVDFYIAKARLVIELDGSQHYEKAGREADRQRDAWLQSQGFQVLRYSNYDANRNFRSVCEDILNHLDGRKPSPSGEGGTAKP
jgi:very-short-patch-repair endonuclease